MNAIGKQTHYYEWS